MKRGLTMENKALIFKPDTLSVTIGDSSYAVVFDMNAFCELERIYGSVDKVLKLMLGTTTNAADKTVRVKGELYDPTEITVGAATLDTLLDGMFKTQTATLGDTLNLLYVGLMHSLAVYNANDEICKYSLSKVRVGSILTPATAAEINGIIVKALFRDLIPAKNGDDEKNVGTPEAE